MKWMHPGETRLVRATLDARVDGVLQLVYRKPNGDEIEANGRYREVVADAKLVFTWAWRATPEHESLVTIVLRPDGDGTLLTLTHEQFADEAARDGHRDGWSLGLNGLERYFSAVAT